MPEELSRRRESSQPLAHNHHCRLSDGTRPNRQPAPAATTAVTADGKHAGVAGAPPPHRCPQPGLPHRRPREYRPHQAARTPSAIAPTTPNLTCRVSITPTPYSATTPTMHTHPGTRTGHHHSHQGEPPTRTHGRDRYGPHHRPLQAPKTCATRTPPPGATGAHLTALQPTPKPAHTPTADRPSAARTRAHSHTAATITTNHHDHQLQPPRPRP